MVRRLTIQLLDIFTKISLYRLQAQFLQEPVQVYLLRYHRFGFYHTFGLHLIADLSNGSQCLISIFCPDYFAALFTEFLFEGFEVSVQFFNSLPFNIFGPFPCHIQVGILHLSVNYRCIVLVNIKRNGFTMFGIINLLLTFLQEYIFNLTHKQ
ncbi:hypothetical protein D3C72_710150 [compost metagenome]